MKVFSVIGHSCSGKTTTIECIIRELRNRGYSVGAVKEIHNEAFKIDTEGKNTYRMREAGADTVTALGYYETDVMYRGKMDIYKLLEHYNQDYVILEGVDYANVPNIATAKNSENLKTSELTFAISGVIADSEVSKNLPVLSALTKAKELTDLIVSKVPPLMPDVDIKCCGACGRSCRDLLMDILQGKAEYRECVVRNNRKVSLTIGGKDIDMVPFVQDILSNTIRGIVGELRGYDKDKEIVIKL